MQHQQRTSIQLADLREASTWKGIGDGYHAALLDAPYGLTAKGRARTWEEIARSDGIGRGFMGKEWDAAVPGPQFFARLRRACVPGAHVVVFGSPRTAHRVACAMEDGGLEVRDTMDWLYATGFPHGLDLAKETGNPALAGYDITLKGAHEVMILARVPFRGTLAANLERHGTGGIHVDGGRTMRGSWPANVVLDEAMAAQLDGLGPHRAGKMKGGTKREARDGNVYNRLGADATKRDTYGDDGGPSRFFFVAKVSRQEREDGCELLEKMHTHERRFHDHPGLGAARKGGGSSNNHATLKPIELTTHLARLLLPPRALLAGPRRLLVPFAGAGSEMIGGIRAGWDTVDGIELIEHHVTIAQHRLAAKAWEAYPTSHTPPPLRQVTIAGQLGLAGVPS